MSKRYSYTLAEIGRMGGAVGEIEYVSMGADRCSVEFVESMRGDGGTDIPWQEGDAVLLWDEDEDGVEVCVFRGWVTEVRVREADWVRRVSVALQNDVALLDALPLETSSYTTRKRVTTAAEALSKGIGDTGGSLCGSYRIDGGGQLLLNEYTSGTESKWGRVLGVARWCPQLMSCYDHTLPEFSFTFSGAGRAKLEGVLSGVEGMRGWKVVSVERRGVAWQVPPVCALRGRYTHTIPEGANVQQPGAFVYHVPHVEVAQEEEEVEKAAVREAAGEWQLVKGYEVPAGWMRPDGEAVDMRTAVANGGEWHEFWKRYFRVLKQTSSACVEFGEAVWEPMAVGEAYPEDAEDDETTALAGVTKFCPPTLETKNGPANYEEFGEGKKMYVLYSGSFPASSVSRANVSGLRFCKGTLRQYVWLKDGVEYSGTAKGAEVEAFFSGGMQLTGEDGKSGARVRYGCLTLDAVFINRRRVRYQVATNAQPERPKVDEDEEDDEGGTAKPTGPTGRDYVRALGDYYDATRDGGGDGTVELAGVWHYRHGVQWGYLLSARWSPMTGRLVLTTGRAEPLGMDALLQRQTLGRRQALDDMAEREALRGQPPLPEEDDEEPGEDEEEKEEEYPMVAPSETANVRADVTAARQEPFAIYLDDAGARWLNGGPLPTPAGIVDVQPQRLDNWKAGRQYFVKAAWSRTDRQWTAKVLWRDAAGTSSTEGEA